MRLKRRIACAVLVASMVLGLASQPALAASNAACSDGPGQWNRWSGQLFPGTKHGIAVGAEAAQAWDADVTRCSGGSDVKAVFDISSADGVWEYLPAMLQAPELKAKTGPASVIVYGAFHGLVLGRTGLQPAELPGAVCVLTSDGDRIVYYDVDLAGFRHP